METSDKEKELCKGKRGNEAKCMELTQLKPWGWFTEANLTACWGSEEY